MFNYQVLYNLFNFSKVQNKAIESMINHFELRLENMEVFITSVEAINLIELVKTLNTIVDSDVIATVGIMDQDITQIKKDLGVLKTNFNGVDGEISAVKETVRLIGESIDNLTKYDDTLLKGKLAEVLEKLETSDSLFSREIKGLKDQLDLLSPVDLEPILTEIEDIKRQLIGFKNYDDSEIVAALGELNRKIGTFDLAPIEGRVSTVESGLDTLEKQNLLSLIRGIQTTLNGLVIPDMYNDTYIRFELSKAKDSIVEVQRRLDTLNIVPYNDGAIWLALNNLKLVVENMETGGSEYDDQLLWVEIDAIKTIMNKAPEEGELDLWQFIQRLTVIEENIASVLLITNELQRVTDDLQEQLDTFDPEDIDLTELNLTFDRLSEDFEVIKAEFGEVKDFTLTTNKLREDLELLTTVVDDLVLNGGGGSGGGVSDEVIVELRGLIADLDTRLSAIVTTEDLNDLMLRMEDIEGLAYHFNGQSEDVIKFVEDNSVRALRFSSEDNLAMYADRTYLSRIDAYGPYPYNNYTTNSYGKSYNGFLGSYTFTSTGYSINGMDFSRTTVHHPNEVLVHLTYTSAKMVSTKMNGSTIVIRLNPAFGQISPDGSLYDKAAYFIVYMTGVGGANGTFNQQINIPAEDIIDGQVNIVIPSVINTLTIVYLPSRLEEYDVNGTNPPLNTLLPDNKLAVDNLFLGIWKIDELPA